MSASLLRSAGAWLAVLALLFAAPICAGQISLEDLTGGGNAASQTSEELSIQERITRTQKLLPDIEREIQQTRALLEAEHASVRPVGIDQLERSVDLLRQLLLLQEQLVSEYQRHAEIERAIESARTERAAVLAGRLNELPPYTFDMLEAMRDTRMATRSLISRAEADINRARGELSRSQDRLRQRSAERRSIGRFSGDTNDATARTEFNRRRELATYQERVAETTVELREIQLKRAIHTAELGQLRLDIAESSIEQIEPRVQFTEDDLDERLAAIEQLQDHLTTSFEQVRGQAAELRDRIEQWTSLESDGDSTVESRIAIARETLIILSAQIEVIGERRRRSSVLREAWTDRYRVEAGELNPRQLNALGDEIAIALDGLDSDEIDLLDRSRQVRARLITLETAPGTALRDRASIDTERIEAYRSLSADIDGALEDIELARRTYSKLAEVVSQGSSISVWDRIAIGWSWLARIWTYEIVTIDESTAITVGKLLIGLGLLALAFNLSRWLSAMLGARVLPRMGLNVHAAAAFRSIAFYVLLLTFALMALRIINVPLTVFAVLGGAVAIGVGFGSQTIASNFISGLILLAERPVRVGDFIEVGGVVGTVTNIGARSTRIKTPTNIEMILPNASLLDNNLINWTLTDQTVWLWIDVGIAYGSPTREASKLLLRAAEEHGRVLKVPAPMVRFEAFGDNSLDFRVVFAINLNKPGDRLSIPSDIRYRIDNLFREAGITIAFPQRDIHIDPLSSMQIELKRQPREAPVDEQIDSESRSQPKD